MNPQWVLVAVLLLACRQTPPSIGAPTGRRLWSLACQANSAPANRAPAAAFVTARTPGGTGKSAGTARRPRFGGPRAGTAYHVNGPPRSGTALCASENVIWLSLSLVDLGQWRKVSVDAATMAR